MVKKRILRILVAGDIFIFALATLGHSNRNETMSAAAWSLEVEGKWQGRLFRPLIDKLLNFLEPNHCYESWLSERTKYN